MLLQLWHLVVANESPSMMNMHKQANDAVERGDGDSMGFVIVRALKRVAFTHHSSYPCPECANAQFVQFKSKKDSATAAAHTKAKAEKQKGRGKG